jgi:hypothetical protein
VRVPFEPVPEPEGCRMHSAEGALEIFDLGVGIGVARIELTPSADATTEAKG